MDASNSIVCQQKVELQGTDENIINDVVIYNITPTAFTITLENTIFGKTAGQGIIDNKTIAWEYRNPDVVEGFEVYEIQDNGDYLFHAEYASDQFRTIIDGRIWKKA